MGKTIANRAAKLQDQQESEAEELVYVRLETIGANIGNLSTVAINERLLVGVLGRLFEPGKSADFGRANRDGSSGTSSPRPTLADDVWAQISDQAQGQPEAVRLAGRCRQALEKLICRLVYPTCHFRRKDVSALVRPPCREDCLLARDLLCPNLDWSKLSQALGRAFNSTLGATVSALGVEAQDGDTSSILGRQTSPAHLNTSSSLLNSSSLHLYWPHEHSVGRCESLPPLRPAPMSRWFKSLNNQPATTVSHDDNELLKHGRACTDCNKPTNNAWYWPTCSNAHLALTPAKLAKHFDCIPQSELTEYEYLGRVNRTRSGLTCQHWLSQYPHQHAT